MIDEHTAERVIELDGHLCPGLADGILVARIAPRETGPHAPGASRS